MKEVEFLPERVREQRARNRRLIRRGYLLAACMAAMGVLAYANAARIAHARAELAALDKRAVAVNSQIQTIKTLEREMDGLLIKKRIDEKLGSRTDCTAVLAELCRVTPPSVSLVSLEMSAVEVGASQRAGSGSTAHRSNRARPAVRDTKSRQVTRRLGLVLTGLAPTDVDVANFIGQLSASCLFEDVNMRYARNVVFRERQAREFQASCLLAR
jgi:Tfp pilus assembly protein PilN